MAGDNEKEMLRAYGRFTDKLNQVDSQAWTQMTERFKDFFNEMRDGIASAAYNAIFFGESFKDATAQILRGLGEQAAVEALMNTAKGIAALTNPFTAAQAPGYFQSAAIFGTAAAVAEHLRQQWEPVVVVVSVVVLVSLQVDHLNQLVKLLKEKRQRHQLKYLILTFPVLLCMIPREQQRKPLQIAS